MVEILWSVLAGSCLNDLQFVASLEVSQYHLARISPALYLVHEDAVMNDLRNL